MPPDQPPAMTAERMLAARIRGALDGETAYEGSTHRLALSMPDWNRVIHALEDTPTAVPEQRARELLRELVAAVGACKRKDDDPTQFTLTHAWMKAKAYLLRATP